MMTLGCSEHFPNQPLPDRPPKTFVALQPDGAMRPSISQQTIHWWGVDPDGFVVGYYWSLDSLSWHFTTRTDSTFSLTLSGTDTVYAFYVRAVDNAGMSDPTGASLRYPIKNTPPTMAFLIASDVPESTFTVASFQWSASDIDGNGTIQNILYALDDTTNPANWHAIPGTARVLTLRRADSLTEGKHVFYARARDLAGAMSPIIRMPRDTSSYWYVREPKSDFLIVDDYQVSDNAASFYAEIFDTLMANHRLAARNILDIKTGASAISRGTFVPALVDPDLTETLKLFRYVYWYSDSNPSMSIAAQAVPGFLKAGKKIFMTTGYPHYPTDFTSMSVWAPIDSMNQSSVASILLGGESLVPIDTTYPPLVRDAGAIYTYPRGILPKVNARPLYKMQSKPSRWQGQPIMGAKDADQASVVYIALLLNRFGTPPNNVAALLRRVFVGEFGVQ